MQRSTTVRFDPHAPREGIMLNVGAWSLAPNAPQQWVMLVRSKRDMPYVWARALQRKILDKARALRLTQTATP